MSSTMNETLEKAQKQLKDALEKQNIVFLSPKETRRIEKEISKEKNNPND